MRAAGSSGVDVGQYPKSSVQRLSWEMFMLSGRVQLVKESRGGKDFTVSLRSMTGRAKAPGLGNDLRWRAEKLG